MEITRGKIQSAKKVVVYGPEGIGKSTFASQFPDPLFIDTEGSTKDLDVARAPQISSWQMLLELVDEVKNTPGLCKTLVIDTIDWAEQYCIQAICDKHQKRGIEDFGYGNGYVYVKEEFGRFLNKLSEVIDKGINVVLTAHAQMRKFEQPDEMGAYDRYELKLGKKTSSQTAPLVKEWADMVLFANYKTYAIAVDDKGKKHKAQGGTRVMYTSHHPCWDAKNRAGLPPELPFDYQEIAFIFNHTPEPVHKKPVPEVNPEPPMQQPTMEVSNKEEGPKTRKESNPEPPRPPVSTEKPEPDSHIPKALRDLMNQYFVSEPEIQEVVALKGYFPENTPIENYPADFINGVLVGAWPQVYACIKEIKEKQSIPFN